MASGSVTYGLEKYATASATNSETGGGAYGNAFADTEQGTASVGVGSQLNQGQSAGFPYTIQGSSLVWVYFGSNSWTGAFYFGGSTISATADLFHPTNNIKDDNGQGAAYIIPSLGGYPISNTISVTNG